MDPLEILDPFTHDFAMHACRPVSTCGVEVCGLQGTLM